ncbi:putative ATPase [Allocatelliglobosispora scoriae]|uniref:Putative ATPase n=1 Tax=Allocatelliglobosispora scoriae TaxID=643052 RepID=A0A841BS64_9ACTN|nr:ATP-binding protein [Allocatelliglobosispora scoriae]MBB5869753.1 putative ATPase [Allocatelliglobosispora scoriae]
MLTRIEIDGFKTFRDFSLDVPPFLVLLGRNASGKSNLFEALQFLRGASEGNLSDAAKQVRGGLDQFFHRYADGTTMDTASFAVELSVPETVKDELDADAPVLRTRLRYELVVGIVDSHSGGRSLVLRGESVSAISADGEVIEPLLSQDEVTRQFILTRRDRGEAHVGGPLPVRSVLSTITSAPVYPELVALRQVFSRWMTAQIEPDCVREPSSYDDEREPMTPRGANVANALRRLAVETGTIDRPEGVFNDLRSELHAVVPDIIDLRIEDDPKRRQRDVVFTDRSRQSVPAVAASDGTLRTLGLLTAVHENRGGLVCLEEPENGIHPPHLVNLLEIIGERVRRSEVDRMPVQVLSSTHAPVVAKALTGTDPLRPSVVVFVDVVSRVGGGGPASRVSKILRLPEDSTSAAEPRMTKSEWRRYLAAGER